MYFNVLEYNTHLFMGTIAAVTEYYYDKERRAAIKQKLGAYQIVGLCEVWSNDSKEVLREGREHWCYDGNTNPLQMGSGLLLLSDYPIIWMSFTEYFDADPNTWDVLAQKGFLIAEISIPVKYHQDQHILVVLTHTQSGDESKKTRKSQFKQLSKAIADAQKNHNDMPVILLGDLNVPATTEEWKKSKEILNMSNSVDTYEYSNPDQDWGRIDYILIKDGPPILYPDTSGFMTWETEVKGKKIPLSDHQPYEAGLRLYNVYIPSLLLLDEDSSDEGK